MIAAMHIRPVLIAFLATQFVVAEDAVSLDLVVRDRRGKPVKEVNAAELLITENGNARPADRVEFKTAGAGTPASHALVTMIFEQPPRELAKLVKEPIAELLAKSDLNNAYFNVVFARERFRILQPYTNDRAALGKAVQAATFYLDSRETDELTKVAEAALQKAVAAETQPAPDTTLLWNMRAQAEVLQKQNSGRVSFNAIRAAIRVLGPLPGRKVVVYVSRGVPSHPTLTATFRDLTEAANAAGVSIYTLDINGFEASERTREGAQMLARAAAAMSSRTGSTNESGATAEQFTAWETAEQTALTNPGSLLGELAVGTGGLLLSDASDSRKLAHQIIEDIAGYWR